MKLSLAVAASFASASSRPRPIPVVRPTRVAPPKAAPQNTTASAGAPEESALTLDI